MGGRASLQELEARGDTQPGQDKGLVSVLNHEHLNVWVNYESLGTKRCQPDLFGPFSEGINHDRVTMHEIPRPEVRRPRSLF